MTPAPHPAAPQGGLALGYASVPPGTPLESPEVELQKSRIASACEHLGLRLVSLVHDQETAGTGDRRALTAALDRIGAGDASCLVVSDLERLSRDVGELAGVVDRLERDGARLIVLDVGLDTATPAGRAALGPSAAPTLPPPRVKPREPAPARRDAPPPAAPPAAAAEPPPAPPAAAASTAAGYALGYASVPADAVGNGGLDAQKRAIDGEAAARGLRLVEVVCEREPRDAPALERAGLAYLLGRIAAGDAACVLVTGLDRLSRSVGELGTILQWLQVNDVRLVVTDGSIDTASPSGRATVATLASVAGWERERLSERTRKGLAAARAKRHAAAGGDTEDALGRRIAKMRADGMTLQAIADTLNREGVPTRRGGAEWRPSSVQTAAGYKRRSRARSIESLPPVERPDGADARGPTG